MVSGASKGLGFAVAKVLAAEGALVSLASRDTSSIQAAKAAIRAGDSTHNLAIALVELQEEEVKASARTLEIRREMVKIFIVMASSAEIAARATALNAEANLAFAQQGVKTRIEFKALSQLLGQQGLTRHAATFRAALVSLGQELRRAGESGVAALHRLAGAILDFAQTQLSALLGGPTRETLMTETRLAELRRQRLLLLQGGQTEEELAPLLGPLDQEIEAIERLLAIRQQEIEIMRLRGQLADAGVLTDREMLRQATLLIGLIASQSEIVRDLNTQLAWEQLAIIGARDSLNLFADALVRARDVVSSISAGTARPAGMLTAGTVAPNYAPNISINVNIDPQLSELSAQVKKQVMDDLDRELRRSGFGGSFVTSGSFVPG